MPRIWGRIKVPVTIAIPQTHTRNPARTPTHSHIIVLADRTAATTTREANHNWKPREPIEYRREGSITLALALAFRLALHPRHKAEFNI